MFNFLFICLFIVIFFIGFLIGRLTVFPAEILIETNVNAVHALSIFVTLFIALLITVFFQTKKEMNNIENELIINRINKITEIIECLQDSVGTGIVPVNQAIAQVKRIHSSSKYIWDICFNDQNIAVTMDFKTVEHELRTLKVLLTLTPVIDSEKTPPIKAVNNQFEYSHARIAEIEKNIEDLKNILFKIQLEVNRKLNR